MQVRCPELEQVLRAAQVLESMLTEIGKCDPFGQRVEQDFRRGARDQHLTAVRQCGQPGRAVDGWSEVVAVALLAHPAVQSHPYAERL